MNWYAGIVEEGARTKSKTDNGESNGRYGEFELLVAKEGPRVVLERGLGKGKAGTRRGRGEDGEEEVEKTFFQK